VSRYIHISENFYEMEGVASIVVDSYNISLRLSLDYISLAS
jgi:hypothetical protein